ncbi:MAG: thiol reductant ABC exporter subunit CydC [Micrococcaceae bacterium]
MKPELPHSRSGRWALIWLAALAVVKAAGWIMLATAVATALGHLAAALSAPDASRLLHLLFNPLPATSEQRFTLGTMAEAGEFHRAMLLGASGVLLRGAALWGQQVMSRRAALGEKERLRLELVRRHLDDGGTDSDSAATDVMLASHGLDELDQYYTDFLPALVSAAVVPAVLGLWVLLHDVVSAVVVVLTVPLIPLFMILIGRYTEERVDEAAEGLDRLSHHLLELARGLPVLVGLRRAGVQRASLRAVSERYRATTMKTLRSAFMSGFALELISTLSVAVVAVFIGVRMVGGDLDLVVGLLILIIAPEIYLPFREVGSAYHAAEDGVDALRRTRQRLKAPQPLRLADSLSREPREFWEAGSEAPQPANRDDDAVLLRDLRLSYPRSQYEDGQATTPADPVVNGLTLAARAGTITVFSGASGTGKSTLLRSLAGTLRDDEVHGSGQVLGLRQRRIAWLDQHPRFTEPTVAEELRLVLAAQDRLVRDGHEEERVAEVLRMVGLDGLAPRRCIDLSPGEARRVGVARVLVRVLHAAPSDEAWLVLLDEPTAHLDPASAVQVRTALRRLRDEVGAVVLIASHDRRLHARADLLVQGDLSGGFDVVAQVPKDERDIPDTPDEMVGTEETETTLPGSGASTPDPADRQQVAGLSWGRTFRLLPWTEKGFRSGIAWAVAALLSGALLSALSGWLIVQASYEPPVLFLLSVIVGVRFFGIGRALFRYLERLSVHHAVLRWANRLRLAVWDGLGRRPEGWNRLRHAGGSLSVLVSDLDELRDAVPRVVVPVPAAVLAWVLSTAVVAYMAPPAWWPVALAGVAGLLVIPVVAGRLDRRATAVSAAHRGWLMQRTTVLFAAAADVQGSGTGAELTARFGRSDHQGAARLKRSAWVAGLGQSLSATVAGLTALAVLWFCLTHAVDGPSAALAVFMVLALAEPFGQVATASQSASVVRRQLGVLEPLMREPPHDDETRRTTTAAAGEVELQELTADYGGAPVLTDLSLTAAPGDFVVVTGPSGSGKSTLLAVLMGFVAPRSGRLRLGSTDIGGRRGSGVAWCPQDAHLFDSTVRSNLLLARDPDDLATDAELTQTLELVGLGPWLASSPLGLDTRVGPGGHFLSGGQRQRLAVARALLNRSHTVLLDEPTAHLGADEAAQLVDDLRAALREHTVVMVTHDRRFADHGSHHLHLTGQRVLDRA